MANKNGETQKLVLDHLTGLRGNPAVTVKEIATDLKLTEDQTKHACARLFTAGKVGRALGRPARYQAILPTGPQTVTPPVASPGSLHGTMPRA